MTIYSFYGHFKRSFIKHVQLDSKRSAQDPEGRFLAICLAAALRENDGLREALFGKQFGKHAPGAVSNVDTEHTFASGKRADIALTDNLGTPLALAEIKCEDQFLPGQLERYLKYCNKAEIPFRTICRYPAVIEGEALVRSRKYRDLDWKAVTINELIRLAHQHSGKNLTKTAMLQEYLMETETTYNETIPSGLRLLATRMFVHDSKSARKTGSRLNSIGDGISTLSTNLGILTENFLNLCIGNRKDLVAWQDIYFGHRLRSKARLKKGRKHRYYSLTDHIDDVYRKDLEDKEEKFKYGLISASELPSHFFEEGRIYFFSYLKKKGPWKLWLELGYYTQTLPNKRTKLFRYVRVPVGDISNDESWKEGRVLDHDAGWRLDDEATELQHFVGLANESITAYLRAYSRKPENREVCTELRSIKKSLATTQTSQGKKRRRIFLR